MLSFSKIGYMIRPTFDERMYPNDPYGPWQEYYKGKEMIKPPNGSEEWFKFYGAFPGVYVQRTGRYEYSQEWWRQNVSTVKLPFVLRLSWDRVKIVRNISVNKVIVDPLYNIFDAIVQAGLSVHVWEFGGTSALRQIRGGIHWSTHSWLAAIDLNPDTNRLGNKPTMHEGIVEIFESHGFTWGGRFSRKDGMHFQFGRNL